LLHSSLTRLVLPSSPAAWANGDRYLHREDESAAPYGPAYTRR